MTSLLKKINSKWLIARHACLKEQTMFEKEWPDGGAITKESLTRAAELGLDLEWFTRRIMPSLLDDQYEANVAPHLAEHQAERDMIYAEYQEKRTLVCAKHRAKVNALVLTILLGRYTNYPR